MWDMSLIKELLFLTFQNKSRRRSVTPGAFSCSCRRLRLGRSQQQLFLTSNICPVAELHQFIHLAALSQFPACHRRLPQRFTATLNKTPDDDSWRVMCSLIECRFDKMKAVFCFWKQCSLDDAHADSCYSHFAPAAVTQMTSDGLFIYDLSTFKCANTTWRTLKKGRIRSERMLKLHLTFM